MKNLLSSIFLFTVLATVAQAGGNTMTESRAMIDISADQKWYPVNDGVMGGLSRSGVDLTEEGTAVFSGQLSLENNGGFASVRTTLSRQDHSAYSGVELRVKGDGRTYQLRFRTDERFDGAAYRAFIPTKVGEWTTVRLPFADFEPTFRGRVLAGYGPLDTTSLRQLTFMLADKKAGGFRLEIGSVHTISSPQQ